MSNSAALLRAAGLKATSTRVRVFDSLLTARQPMSHADLEALLPDADRVTLYRVLDALVSCGLALKAADARGVFRFSASAVRRAHEGHIHFRCTGCGAVYCLAVPPPRPPRLPRGFRLDEADYELRGACADCARYGGSR